MLLKGIQRRASAVWAWIGANETQLKIVFAVIAAVYVLVEYRQKQEAERVAASVEYVRKHAEGTVVAARDRLNQFWIDDSVTASLMRIKAVPDLEARVIAYDGVVRQQLKGAGHYPDVRQLLHFYGDVTLCVRTSLCEKAVACDYFFASVQGFRENYRPILEDWRDTQGDTSVPDVAEFVERTCGAQFANYCLARPTSAYCRENPRAVVDAT